MQKDKNLLGLGEVTLKQMKRPILCYCKEPRVAAWRERMATITTDIFPSIRAITHSAGIALGCLPPGNGSRHFQDVGRIWIQFQSYQFRLPLFKGYLKIGNITSLDHGNDHCNILEHYSKL